MRYILGEISRRKGKSAGIMYTGDQRAFETDEIFVNFITGSHDALVVEDADHLLTAGSSGNLDLHWFLYIADGVVRAQGRKILFTTNLPNVHDIDPALLRPGRFRNPAHPIAHGCGGLEADSPTVWRRQLPGGSGLRECLHVGLKKLFRSVALAGLMSHK